MTNKKIAIQDTYGKRFRNCWGCGPDNDQGLHLKSYPSEDSTSCIASIIPDEKYTGGVPKNLFGGMIAMLFDCHGTASAAYFNHKAKGKDLSEDTIIERYITARLEVDYIKPTPMNEEVIISSTLEQLGERKAIVEMTLKAAGQIRAKAKLIAVKVKDNM